MGIKFLNSRQQPAINYVTANGVPKKFENILADLNFVYAHNNVDASYIVGRSKEMSRICNTLLRRSKKNVVLLGDHGVGKRTIIQKLVTNVILGRCPKELKDIHFFKFFIKELLTRMDEKRVIKILDELTEFIFPLNNVVLVIEDLHLMQSNLLLSDFFATLVSLPHTMVIGITTEKEFENYFEVDVKTKLRLEVIPIEPPEHKKIYHMIRKVVKQLESYHKVKISEEMVWYIISISNAFLTELNNPELTLDIIEKSMISAKNRGEKFVTKQAINTNFNFNYSLYKKIPRKDKERTAYHEAGHFIVQKLSNIYDCRTTAITIVPAEGFLGLTTFEYEIEKQGLSNIDYYVDWIAVSLGGRIAEGIYEGSCDNTKAYSSGAEADLIQATATARRIITELGMVSDVGENISYLGAPDFIDLSLLSEDIKNSIDKATKKLIKKGKERANAILTENLDLLDSLAKELLRNDVLVESDLKRICDEVFAAR